MSDVTPRDLARAYYDAFLWSGCNGSRWDKVPEDGPNGQRMVIRQARDWLLAMAVVAPPQRCSQCGDRCLEAFHIVAHVQTTSTEHEDRLDFCMVGCLTDWVAECGYRDDDDWRQ